MNLKKVETREKEREAYISKTVLMETRERLAHAERKPIAQDSSPLTHPCSLSLPL